MPRKEPEHVLAIHEHDGRLVSGPTKWWVEHAPNGYCYYCIHAVSLDVECDKCKRKVMRFERKAT